MSLNGPLVTGISDRLNIVLVRQLNEALAAGAPRGARWSSLQLNHNAVAGPHVDKGNEGLSLLITLGPYAGGECLIGNTVTIGPGAHGKDLAIGGHREHCSRSFLGERFSIVAFLHESVKQLAPRLIGILKQARFPFRSRDRLICGTRCACSSQQARCETCTEESP